MRRRMESEPSENSYHDRADFKQRAHKIPYQG